MPEPTIAADLLETLDVLGTLAAQVALDRYVLVDRLAKLDDLFLGEVANLAVGLDPDLGKQLIRVERPIP